jgi:hypothetical protein
VQVDRDVEALGALPEWVEGPVVQIAPAGLPEQHGSGQPELLDGALEFVRALGWVLQRGGGEGREPVRPRPHHLGEMVIGLPGDPQGFLRLQEPLDRGATRQHGPAPVRPARIRPHHDALGGGRGRGGPEAGRLLLRLQAAAVRAATTLPFDPAEMVPGIIGGDPAGIGERVASFLVGMLEDADAGSRIVGLIRAAAAEPEAAAMVRDLLIRDIWTRSAELLPADQPELRISLMSCEVLGLVMARYVIGAEPLASLPPEAVVAAIAPALQQVLDGPIPST